MAFSHVMCFRFIRRVDPYAIICMAFSHGLGRLRKCPQGIQSKALGSALRIKDTGGTCLKGIQSLGA